MEYLTHSLIDESEALQIVNKLKAEKSSWQDGKKTAGSHAAKIKSNFPLVGIELFFKPFDFKTMLILESLFVEKLARVVSTATLSLSIAVMIALLFFFAATIESIPVPHPISATFLNSHFFRNRYKYKRIQDLVVAW